MGMISKTAHVVSGRCLPSLLIIQDWHVEFDYKPWHAFQSILTNTQDSMALLAVCAFRCRISLCGSMSAFKQASTCMQCITHPSHETHLRWNIAQSSADFAFYHEVPLPPVTGAIACRKCWREAAKLKGAQARQVLQASSTNYVNVCNAAAVLSAMHILQLLNFWFDPVTILSSSLASLNFVDARVCPAPTT